MMAAYPEKIMKGEMTMVRVRFKENSMDVPIDLKSKDFTRIRTFVEWVNSRLKKDYKKLETIFGKLGAVSDYSRYDSYSFYYSGIPLEKSGYEKYFRNNVKFSYNC